MFSVIAGSHVMVTDAHRKQELLKTAHRFNVAGVVIGVALNVIGIIYIVIIMMDLSDMQHQKQQRLYGDY